MIAPDCRSNANFPSSRIQTPWPLPLAGGKGTIGWPRRGPRPAKVVHPGRKRAVFWVICSVVSVADAGWLRGIFPGQKIRRYKSPYHPGDHAAASRISPEAPFDLVAARPRIEHGFLRG